MKTNKVFLIGILGKDIEIIHFNNGCIGNVSLATNEVYTNKQTGEKISNTEWHNLVFKNKQANIIEKYAKKGSKLFVIGRLKYRSWEQNGDTKYKTEIHVNEFEFLSKLQNESNNNGNSQNYEEEHDDLPF